MRQLYIFCFALLIQTAVVAQGTLGRTSIADGNTYALVIGISSYADDKIKDLNFAHKDAEAFADYLTSKSGGQVPAENIKLLVNEQATISNIYVAMRELNAKLKQDDLIFFYFSGHGDVETGLYELGFLLAHDTPHKNYLTNAVRIEDVNQMANTLSIQKGVKVILITDACHSGKLAGSDNRGSFLAGEQLAKAEKNEIRMASCEAAQKSQEGDAWGGGRGVFSYYLINGMMGLADAGDKDGVVTLMELKFFLETKVPTDVAKFKEEEQIPVLKGKSLAPIAVVDDEEFKKIEKVGASAGSGSLAAKSVSYTPPPADIYFQNLSKTDISHKVDFAEWKDMKKKKVIDEALDAFKFCETGKISKSDWRKSLKKKNDARDEYAARLSSVLHNNAQAVVNKFVTADKEKMEKMQYTPEEIDELDNCVYMFETAELLANQDDYLYKIIRVKKHYTKGLAARLKIPYSTNIDSLMDVAVAEMEKAIAIEDKAAFVHFEMSTLSSYQTTGSHKKIKRTIIRRNNRTTRTIRTGN